MTLPPTLHVSPDVTPPATLPVLDLPMHVLTPDEAVRRIAGWSAMRSSRVVAVCNAHSLVTARQDPRHAQALQAADLRTPDGAPVAWVMRRLGAHGQVRVSGPELMLDCCAHAAAIGEPVFLLGGTPATLARLQTRLLERWPALRIAGAVSPPFRPMTDDEDAALVGQINASGAGTVWVGLGCPKQERWMADHRGRVHAVMVGVGAAFDFHAGSVARAPLWMREHGLEWLHRLASDPRRLWRRYLSTNSRFVLHTARQLLRQPRPK
ncbi:WecB/TagA/CpsF family glycosyltransferase [Leptothrix sp. BB-4]